MPDLITQRSLVQILPAQRNRWSGPVFGPIHDPSRLHFVLNNPARFEDPRVAKPQVDPLGSLGCRFLEPTKGLSANRLQTGGSRRHSRPRCSNDNPYSESQVRTLKYRPDFPARFGSFEDARGFCGDFFGWYNK